MKKLTTEEFIKKAKKVHGDLYDYSKVEYKGNRENVIIICKEHGEFSQSPKNHLNGNKCKLCSFKVVDKKTFISESKKVHGDLYDYSKVEYKGNREKVIIICKEHGEFLQTPFLHYNNSGCPRCKGGVKDTKETFIEKAKKVYGDIYDYSKVNYTLSSKKVIIICKEHGEFLQSPRDHLSNRGCRKCGYEKNEKTFTLDTSHFIEKAKKIHGNKYDYSKVDYNKSKQGVIIICKEHGDFSQRPNNHLCGASCPKCNNTISKPEKELLDFIKENYQGKIIESDRSILNPLELDIYLPGLNIAFEFNGLYWHNELFLDKNYHLNKTEKCLEKGIHLIHIYEDSWDFKTDIVKSRVLNLLQKSNRIYARKCDIRQVKKYKDFLVDNHLQGFVASPIRLGLYYNNELVSLMTFGKARFKQEGYELLRFCNKLNTTVIGGSSKLFKHFVKNNNFEKIISYADRSWSNGNLYEKLNFKYVDKTKPNYYYVNNGVRENRFNYRKGELVKQGFDKNKTEKEIMFERDLYRIYDSGNLKYIF